MKAKTLRKIDTKEFANILHFNHDGNTLDLFTTEIPSLMPMTATMDELKEIHIGNIPSNFSFDDLELIELDIHESGVIGADIRNKLSPPKNLVALLDVFLRVKVRYVSKERGKLVELMKTEMKNTKENIKYLSDLL